MNGKDMKMAMLHRAVGQIEGVAFFQSEIVRDLLLGAAEDITSGVESMKEQMEAAREVGLMQTTQIERLMKDKDDLLTENGKLREAGERIATSAAPPCNDEEGENTAKNDGCVCCKGFTDLFNWGGIEIRVKGNRLAVKREKNEQTSRIKFCPLCGREL